MVFRLTGDDTQIYLTKDNMDCDDCTEDYVFLLKQGGREFGMGLTTVLSMLAFAEHEGAAPPLPPEWWVQVSNRY